MFEPLRIIVPRPDFIRPKLPYRLEKYPVTFRVRGLRRASQRLSERVQQAGLAAADKAQEIGRQALDKAQELGDAFHQRSTDTDAALPEAKGKTATRRDVLADDGTQEE